jgi:hypothetical protein
MSIPGPNEYSRVQREEIIDQWSQEKVVAEAEKTVGRATCDRSIFLRRACVYKAEVLRIENKFQQGGFDYETPFGSGKYTRSGMADYRLQVNQVKSMRRQLIETGIYQMGVLA